MAKNDAAPPAEAKKGGKLKWFILLLVILLLAGGGAAAYWFLMGPGATPPDAAEEGTESSGEATKPQAEFLPEIVTLSPFIVNLADPLGRRFLRMTLDVEVLNQTVVSDLQNAESRIRDAIILLLSSKSFSDLASMESKITLKNQIVERLNQIMGGGKVTNVYFTEFVIQ